VPRARGVAWVHAGSEWMSVKHTLGLPFPNLPYLIQTDPDGTQLRLTQSNSIVRVRTLGGGTWRCPSHSVCIHIAVPPVPLAELHPGPTPLPSAFPVSVYPVPAWIVPGRGYNQHLGRLAGLCGKTEAEAAQVDMLLEQEMDLRNAIVRVAYRPRADYFDALSAATSDVFPSHLRGFEAFITGDWLLDSAGGL
jgi:hypothetical protein